MGARQSQQLYGPSGTRISVTPPCYELLGRLIFENSGIFLRFYKLESREQPYKCCCLPACTPWTINTKMVDSCLSSHSVTIFSPNSIFSCAVSFFFFNWKHANNGDAVVGYVLNAYRNRRSMPHPGKVGFWNCHRHLGCIFKTLSWINHWLKRSNHRYFLTEDIKTYPLTAMSPAHDSQAERFFILYFILVSI